MSKQNDSPSRFSIHWAKKIDVASLPFAVMVVAMTAAVIVIIMAIDGNRAADALLIPATAAQTSPPAETSDYFPGRYPTPSGPIEPLPPTF